MSDSQDSTIDETWLVKEPLAIDSYGSIPAEVQTAARSKIDDPEALYWSLVRSLRRRKGFGILFLQCTPAKGQEIFARLKQDLHRKRLERLTLSEPINNLFALVREREEIAQTDILFIEGIEHSLSPYIKTEAGRNDYYKLEVLPPILDNVNRLRDNFRERFPHLCFVFVVPPFALKYFMFRAIDFFAWHSGIWRFAPEKEQIERDTAKALGGNSSEYKRWSEQERQSKIQELQNLIDLTNQSDEKKAALLSEQGMVFIAAQNWAAALRCFDEVIELGKIDANVHFLKGYSLIELGEYEEAIAAYDQALAIKPDYHEALYNKGIALSAIGRNEDAIAAYDQALAIKPDDHEALNNKGIALSAFGRNEDAITAYDQALAIKPDDHEALFNKGNALTALSRHEDAIAAYDQALAIKPDDHRVLRNKGNALSALGRGEDATAAYEQAAAIRGPLLLQDLVKIL